MASNTATSALVQAYIHALSQSGSAQVVRDPVKNVYYNETNSFDHDNIFNFLDGSGFAADTINTVNIQNAATLYAIMIIGDEMGVFRVADVSLKYVTLGHVDVESTSTATRLYNYMKLRDQRTTAEERAMFYKQVFNMGQGQTMDRMATNQSFWPLMESLFHGVIEYIRKYEIAEEPSNISQSPVRQIIRDLQHNLSRAASGMVKLYIPEMYAHLEDAIQIISAPEIRDQIGQGVARDLWNVVEVVSMEEFGYYPNTSALRTVAAAARSTLLDIARYSDGSFDNTDFQNFIENVEALIIAQSQVEGEGSQPGYDYGYPNQNGMNGHGYRSGYRGDDGYRNGGSYAEPELMEEDWNF
jgi:hypothetical protein